MELSRKKVSLEQQKIVDNLRKVLGDKDFQLFERLSCCAFNLYKWNRHLAC
ncbi:MAG: hypothetical protein VKL60_18580 [Sphaerospermopsis sp.]|nr:hypothetical protein [Sphaerospermopsis sp.]